MREVTVENDHYNSTYGTLGPGFMKVEKFRYKAYCTLTTPPEEVVTKLWEPNVFVY